MKEIVKNYNYCDLKLDFENECVNKNKLSIKESVNISLTDNIIKPTKRFDNLFSDIFDEVNYQRFLDNHSTLSENIIYLNAFDYYDIDISDYRSIYFLIDSDYKLYKMQFSSAELIIENTDIVFNKMPQTFTNNGKFYFYSKDDKFVYFESFETMISISNYIGLISFCNFQDNSFFVLENNSSVLFTENIEIEDISEDLSFYNQIQVESSFGKILKLIKFKNNLYIVQQYGISRIWLNSGEYYIYSNCSISSQIYLNTIGEFNDYLVFYTSSGLYLFDGNEIKQIFSIITNKITLDNQNDKAVVFNNKYYLLSKMKISGESKNVIIEFDIFTMIPSINIIGNVQNLYAIKTILDYNLVAVCEDNGIYKLLKLSHTYYSDNTKYIKFNKLTFDDNLSKNITAIRVISNGNYYLKISSEQSQKIIKVNGNLIISTLGLSGYAFDLEVYSEEYFAIKSFLFSVQTITE